MLESHHLSGETLFPITTALTPRKTERKMKETKKQTNKQKKKQTIEHAMIDLRKVCMVSKPREQFLPREDLILSCLSSLVFTYLTNAQYLSHKHAQETF